MGVWHIPWARGFKEADGGSHKNVERESIKELAKREVSSMGPRQGPQSLGGSSRKKLCMAF